MFCKTIILSNKENLNNNAPKGILSVTNDNNNIHGKIRLYNLAVLPTNCKLGIHIAGEVLVSSLVKRPSHYEFDINKRLDLNKSMYCAIIDNSTGEKRVLLEGGNASGFSFTDSPADAVTEAKDDELDKLISTSIDSCSPCSSCENCEYKKYFYENYPNHTPCKNQSPQQSSTNKDEFDISSENEYTASQPIVNPPTHEPIQIEENNPGTPQQSSSPPILDNSQKCNSQLEQSADTNQPLNIGSHDADNLDCSTSSITQSSQNQDIGDTSFLNDIIYQLDEMFKQYPNDELIMSVIPNSRFIKVSIDQSSPYILGVIYEDKIMKYIAYGVPASYNSLPPADFGQNYQWLPLNPDDIMSDGYFMIYQDASNGQVVNLQIK